VALGLPCCCASPLITFAGKEWNSLWPLGHLMIPLLRRALAILSTVALLSCRSTHAPPLRQTIDEATVTAMSHALLDAYDRADEDGFARAVEPTFVLFDELRLEQRDAILNALRKRRERQAPARSRTYGEQRVSIGSSAAVFIGETVEHYPADSARPMAENIPAIPMEFDGWSTIVWARDSEEWKAASWQWVKGGSDASREKWDATYREGRAFNPQPSKFLHEMVRRRKPGLALDVGMGQGRNALWLASQGWRVTGIDISDEGIRQAREAAAARNLTIDAIRADADTWDYGVEKWDLAVLIYANGNDASLRRAMKPGGLIVGEWFHKDSVPKVGTDQEEIAARFKDDFRILRNEVVEDVSDWGWKERVPQKLIRFAAEKR
jgi:SAM-dependent methyltransferase